MDRGGPYGSSRASDSSSKKSRIDYQFTVENPTTYTRRVYGGQADDSA